ncbi:hypothetical protein [Ramlibacter sp.]|uniref:hypothetical protein n=1 Tax=Ramlibacter sp. TaxID=1917967 RepID=UPI002FC7E4BC
MNFDVVIDQKARYVRVALTGNPSIGQLLSMIHLLGVESETWQQTATLVDLRGVVTEYSQLEQFRIGEEAASSLSHMDKIASVVPTARITRISQRAARRNGVDLCVFGDEREAVEWLLS